MKNKFIIAAAYITGIAIVTYFLKRSAGRKNIPTPAHNVNSHHITNVFSKAKKRMSNIESDES